MSEHKITQQEAELMIRQLIALRHPDIDKKNIRRCELIDLYYSRGGMEHTDIHPTVGMHPDRADKYKLFSKEEFKEFSSLEQEVYEWLRNKHPELVEGPTNLISGCIDLEECDCSSE